MLKSGTGERYQTYCSIKLYWFLVVMPEQSLFAFQVIAESLSGEEIAGLKEMFKMIDADNSGHITLEELKTGLEKVGANLNDSEIVSLMQAVSICMLHSRSFLCALYVTLVLSYCITCIFYKYH